MTSALPGTQEAKSRLLVALVLDGSTSMGTNGAIDELNKALREWREQLAGDSYLRRIGEIALVSFGAGGTSVIDPSGRNRTPLPNPFVPIGDFDPPPLTASGFSPMVPAVKHAIELVDRRREELRQAGIGMAYRPLVYLLTDGAPSDEQGRPSDRWQDLAPELRRQEDERLLMFFAFGVQGADMRVLETLAPRGHYRIDSNSFSTVLRAVMHSIRRVMNSGRDAPSETVHEQVRNDIDDLQELQKWFWTQAG